MKPIMARLTGAASVVALSLGVMAFTAQQRAEAQTPVCFTTWGGDCYCIDFFFTMVKEKVISQGQQYINNLMGEYDELMTTGAAEVLGQQIGHSTTYRGYADADHREQFSQPVRDRPTPSGAAIPAGVRDALGRDPDGATAMGRQARAIATASEDAESLAPYSIDRSVGAGVDPEAVQDWTDRMVLEPPVLHIPSDEGLAQMGMRDLHELYEEARHYLGANYARYHLRELAASEQRIQALEESRERIDGGQLDQPGAAISAGLVAQTVNLAIETELLESQLRKEGLMASVVAMRIGGAYESQ